MFMYPKDRTVNTNSEKIRGSLLKIAVMPQVAAGHMGPPQGAVLHRRLNGSLAPEIRQGWGQGLGPWKVGMLWNGIIQYY